MKTTPTPEQMHVTADAALPPEQGASRDQCIAFAQACALDRIAQAINRFADVVEKATKEHA